MKTNPSTYIIGDIHGQYKKLIHLLKEAGLIGNAHNWTGGQTTVWFMGDFVDRGPDGIAVIELVMKLQAEAAAVGGKVESLIGNHELMLLAAYRFGRRSTGLGSSFLSRWKRNGGQPKDLAGLTLKSIEWLSQLPAMAQVGDNLLIHADAPLYLTHGNSINEVNTAFSSLIKKSDALAWEELLEAFVRRGAFIPNNISQDVARHFLTKFGGQKIVHGHTPISAMRSCHPKNVSEALSYADGQCINVDGGMYLGGPGFIYQLPV